MTLTQLFVRRGCNVSVCAAPRGEDLSVAQGAMPPPKNWDAILAELSSGEDSDAHDELNVRSVQKHAQRVADMVRTAVPGLGGGADLPGMNHPDVIRAGLADAIGAASPRSRGPSAAPPSTHGEEAAAQTQRGEEEEAPRAPQTGAGRAPPPAEAPAGP